MSELLTPQEALQALIGDKRVEVKFDEYRGWETVDIKLMNIDELIDPTHQFRLVQEMITIGDVSFPKPESIPLQNGTRYWIANPFNPKYITAIYAWLDDSYDRQYLRRGLIHQTEENAIAHAKALIKLSGGTIDE